MDSDSPIPEASNQAVDESEATPRNGLRYVEPAPLIDVMFDQLAYLLAHVSQGCLAGCQDCVRLKQVESWLLQPFFTTDFTADDLSRL